MKYLANLIKKHGAVRIYSKRFVTDDKIKKIVEAGIWASSIHGFQPWEFVAVKNTKIISKIAKYVLDKSDNVGRGANFLLKSTARTIAAAPLILLVFNNQKFYKFTKKYFKMSKKYFKIADIAEKEAVGAAIQNMLLMADALGIGNCWTITPMFCEYEIKQLVNNNNNLLAILTFGYSKDNVKRSRRTANYSIIK